jgi:hypothetical protein
VSSLLSSCSSYLDCGDTCTLLLIRNHGQDRKEEGLAQAGFELQKNTKCDEHKGRIRSWIGAFKYSMERG